MLQFGNLRNDLLRRTFITKLMEVLEADHALEPSMSSLTKSVTMSSVVCRKTTLLLCLHRESGDVGVFHDASLSCVHHTSY